MLGLADRTLLAPTARYQTEQELIDEVSIISHYTSNNSISEVMSWPSNWRRGVWDSFIERMKKKDQ